MLQQIHNIAKGMWTPDPHNHMRVALNCCHRAASTQTLVRDGVVCSSIKIFFSLELVGLAQMYSSMTVAQNTPCTKNKAVVEKLTGLF